MENYSEANQCIFRGRKRQPLLGFVVYLVVFIIFINELNFKNSLPIKDLFAGQTTNLPEDFWPVLIAITVMFLALLFMLFAFIASSKSYIELTNSDLIINKPVHYPFTNIETIYVPYKEIKNVKIVPTKLGWKVILTKNDDFGDNRIIKFFGLNDGKSLDEKIKDKGVKSYISYSGWDNPPEV